MSVSVATQVQLESPIERESPSVVESDPLTLYLGQISAYPLLTREEEIETGRLIVESRDELARLDEELRRGLFSGKEYRRRRNSVEERAKELKNRMITGNLRLVVSIAKRYQHRGLGLLDLINEGNIGLIEAVERFDYTRGCKFSTYGTWWIQQAIVKSLADTGRTIRIPIHILNIMRRCFSVFKHLTQELGRDPKLQEVADFMNLPATKVRQYLRFDCEAYSLDTTVDEEHLTSLADLISSDAYAEPFEAVFRNSLQDVLANSLAELDYRERRILQLRYGLGEEAPLTLEEIGAILHITRERVRQIQNKAIERLRTFDAILELQEVI